ncbi:preprotein translocase subunit YajC [Vaginisenegalia massiliensis]|uniref:preprotein translocase subunit YajC n=1 Tax=Vaginisenegalia massiliensis TaxID=2058294 RepID=UPI000F53AA40|nr:preprotein translocase subunit YajC [Vaginisenegalia massiliensis]
MNTFWYQVMVTSFVVLAMVLLTIGLYYIASRKSIKTRKTHFEQLHQNLKVGQKVEFGNGLRGTVAEVGLDTCDIKVKSGAIITVSRYTISDILDK